MTVFTLVSASGSPGVTSTALGLALCWPRPVLLVDADPTGGASVLAGFLRGTRTATTGLLHLAIAFRGGYGPQTLPEVTMTLGERVRFVPGTTAHDQARGLVGLWEPLAGLLRGLDEGGQDVLVDAGRLGLVGSPEPLIAGSDVLLLVCRSDLVALSAARSWVETLSGTAGGGSALGLLLIEVPGGYCAREVSRFLRVGVVARLPWDPAGAAVYGHGAPPPGRRLWRRREPALQRGLVAAAEAVRAMTAPAPVSTAGMSTAQVSTAGVLSVGAAAAEGPADEGSADGVAAGPQASGGEQGSGSGWSSTGRGMGWVRPVRSGTGGVR